MGSNRLAFAAVGLACITAAAGGSYVATRHNVAQYQGAVTTEAPSSAVAAGAPVQEPAPPSDTASAVAGPAATPPAAVSVMTQRPPEAAKAVAPTRSSQRSSSRAPLPPAHLEQPAPAPDRSAPGFGALPPVAAEPVQVARDERSVEAARPVEPPAPAFEELTVSADSVIGLQTETTLSSERARIEDRVEARVVRDVRVGGQVAIPAGTRALGSVVVVERGGKMRDRARLGIRFHTLALADGTRLPITTETIYRYGDAPGNGSAAKIGGGAVAGAILGAIIGGGKGAAIGATTGAAGGSAAVMSGDRSEAVFASGAEVTARILAPVTVTVDR
ncbi:MAG TPA: hypothetical protein VM032_13980 [Vicinamibacterales bacterium]|nr:hypothetical protein [Vicinamibacterales bacterium]